MGAPTEELSARQFVISPYMKFFGPDGYYAEEVPATGPWHARFLFCGWYRLHPNEVRVEAGVTAGVYYCSVGEPPNMYAEFEEQRRDGKPVR